MTYKSEKLPPGELEETEKKLRARFPKDTFLLFRCKDTVSNGLPSIDLVAYPLFKETKLSWIIRWPHNSKGYKVLAKDRRWRCFAYPDTSKALANYTDRKKRHMAMLANQFKEAKERYLMSINKGVAAMHDSGIPHDIEPDENFTF